MSTAKGFARYKLRVHVAVAIVIQITEDLLWQATWLFLVPLYMWMKGFLVLVVHWLENAFQADTNVTHHQRDTVICLDGDLLALHTFKLYVRL